MKTKHAVMLVALGYCCDLIGAMLKIMHSPNANMLLMVGVVLKIAGGLLFLYKIVTYPRFRDFFNS